MTREFTFYVSKVRNPKNPRLVSTTIKIEAGCLEDAKARLARHTSVRGIIAVR
jgi:hypothetical protein